jgi:hypothetical protein
LTRRGDGERTNGVRSVAADFFSDTALTKYDSFFAAIALNSFSN